MFLLRPILLVVWTLTCVSFGELSRQFEGSLTRSEVIQVVQSQLGGRPKPIMALFKEEDVSRFGPDVQVTLLSYLSPRQISRISKRLDKRGTPLSESVIQNARLWSNLRVFRGNLTSSETYRKKRAKSDERIEKLGSLVGILGIGGILLAVNQYDANVSPLFKDSLHPFGPELGPGLVVTLGALALLVLTEGVKEKGGLVSKLAKWRAKKRRARAVEDIKTTLGNMKLGQIDLDPHLRKGIDRILADSSCSEKLGYLVE